MALLDAVAEPLPAGSFAASTHAIGVAQAIEPARRFGRLPERLVVFGVESARFEVGEGLSPAGQKAIRGLDA